MKYWTVQFLKIAIERRKNAKIRIILLKTSKRQKKLNNDLINF